MWIRNLMLATLFLSASHVFAQGSESLPAGSSAFVLIARLHALPGQADKVVALSSAVDKKVEAGEPGMLLHTFDQDPRDPQGFVWTEVYENSDALIFHLNNADLAAYLEAVSPLLDVFTIELYGAVSDDAVAALSATETPVTHYANLLGYIRDLTP
ncbi:MAG: antibiotic biosynthesis monooxygenase [Luminiphilus sp.]|jgi:quinol monooxygenase YgiN|nr:antibiotic biosynthesis monooxygenase [Luminiphilus sp.]